MCSSETDRENPGWKEFVVEVRIKFEVNRRLCGMLYGVSDFDLRTTARVASTLPAHSTVREQTSWQRLGAGDVLGFSVVIYPLGG